jgi:uncharacterized secreted protein with C-terminal beta-propeller domain
MNCPATNCKSELIDKIHKEVETVKDKLIDDIKEERDKSADELKRERGSIYNYINSKCKEWSDKLEDNRKEAARLCTEVANEIKRLIPEKAITTTGFLTALGSTIACVSIIVIIFTTIVTRANDRENRASDQRISANETVIKSHTEKLANTDLAIVKLTAAIESLSKATEELKIEVKELNNKRMLPNNK